MIWSLTSQKTCPPPSSPPLSHDASLARAGHCRSLYSASISTCPIRALVTPNSFANVSSVAPGSSPPPNRRATTSLSRSVSPASSSSFAMAPISQSASASASTSCSSTSLSASSTSSPSALSHTMLLRLSGTWPPGPCSASNVPTPPSTSSATMPGSSSSTPSRRILPHSVLACAGTRIVRPMSATPRPRYWCIQMTAYVLNRSPRSGSQRRTVSHSPRLPSWIRSSSSTPRLRYRIASETTSRQLCSMSCSPAALSPARNASPSVPSCAAVSRSGQRAVISPRYQATKSSASLTRVGPSVRRVTLVKQHPLSLPLSTPVSVRPPGEHLSTRRE